MATSRGVVVAVVFAGLALGLGAVFVGCGGIGIKPVKLEDPIRLAGPVELADKPIKLDALRIDQTVPISIAQPVPITIAGPITIKLEGPSVDHEGTYVSEALMERVVLGTTTAEWVEAVIGKPDSVSKMSDGTEIWKWVYRPVGSALSVVGLLGGDEKKPQPQPITAYVRLKDGVVVDKWRG
jgi:hypothetical protein